MYARACFCFIFRRSLCQSRLPKMSCGKLDSPEFHQLCSPDLLRLEKIFSSQGYTLRLVGGAVRDLLLGKKPKDIDLATDCIPQKMVMLLDSAGVRHIPTGLQHGTITAHMNDGDFEITTLRVDKKTDGRHAEVEFTKDWKVDANRRDLTINAMSLSLDGTLFDYFDGKQHIAERRVEFVGSAKLRIEEDYLRILRYFRFYGRIVCKKDEHNPSILAAIKEAASGLKNISVERVWMEMNRILIGNHAPHLVEVMYQLGVAAAIGLPDNPDNEELFTVWKRTYSYPSCTLQPVSMLVTLTRSLNDAVKLMSLWKLSRKEIELGSFIVDHRRKGLSEHTKLKYFQDLLVDGSPSESVIQLLHYCGRLEYIGQLKEWAVPKMPLNGKHLIDAGITPGSEMGKLLRLAKDKWKESHYAMNTEELIDYVTSIRTQQ